MEGYPASALLKLRQPRPQSQATQRTIGRSVFNTVLREASRHVVSSPDDKQRSDALPCRQVIRQNITTSL